MRIGLLSDTHSHLDDLIFQYLEPCDEIWHAGDIGNEQTWDQLTAFKPCRGVTGNIDGAVLRRMLPETLNFELEGVKTSIIHIAGAAGKYNFEARKLITATTPKLFICGHSHILKVQYDKNLQMLHVNPGAAGVHGFHAIRTLLRFTISEGNISNMEVVELGKRGAITKK
ncbi:MAG: metallophosphoesterase family protein [Saprospiraceae bacterium]